MSLDKIRLKEIIPWLILTVIICPFIIGIMYCVPEADDFTFARHLVENRLIYGNDIEASLALGKKFYFTWQGTYFSNVTPIFFSPFLRAGIVGYHFELITILLIFVLALIYFAYILVKNIIGKPNSNMIAAVTILVFVYATIRSDLSEIFYWHCGALVYLLPISLGIVSCSYVWSEHNKNKIISWIEVVIFAVFSFLSVGGTLTVSAAVSGFMVLIVTLKFIENKRSDKTVLVALMAVVGSFVNALAPGNFVRQAGEVGEASVKTAIFDSLDYLIDAYYGLLKDGSIIIVVVCLVLIFWKKIDIVKYQFKYPVAVTMWLLVVSFLGIFPVMYGHKSDFVADRSEFAELIIIMFLIVFAAIYWMGWIKKNKITELSNEFYGIIIALCVVSTCIYCNSYGTDDYNFIRISRNYRDGNLQEYFQANMDLLNEIENADTVNVVLEFYEPDNMGIYDDMCLSDDPYNWINDAIARYYGKETLSIIYCDSGERD